MDTINVRDLQRNFKETSEQVQSGRSFVVLKNAQPIFRIEPIETSGDKKELLKKLQSMQFESDSNLSGKIDKIVYE